MGTQRRIAIQILPQDGVMTERFAEEASLALALLRDHKLIGSTQPANRLRPVEQIPFESIVAEVCSQTSNLVFCVTVVEDSENLPYCQFYKSGMGFMYAEAFVPQFNGMRAGTTATKAFLAMI